MKGEKSPSRLMFIRQTYWGTRINVPKRTQSRGLYLCECGTEKDLVISEVRRGKTRSCGCLTKTNLGTTKHGIWNSPLYNVWMDIKNRCYKERHKAYKYYGGRGVRMCDEWYNDVLSFSNWAIANGWKRKMHVDKDIKGDGLLYSPDTCSIVTILENMNHRRKTIRVNVEGVTKSLADWCRFLNVEYSSVYKNKGTPDYYANKISSIIKTQNENNNTYPTFSHS